MSARLRLWAVVLCCIEECNVLGEGIAFACRSEGQARQDMSRSRWPVELANPPALSSYFHFCCIQVDPLTGGETSSQTTDIECVKYKKFKEIRTNVPSIVRTSQKKHKMYVTQSLHNHPSKKLTELQ
jgi:hypothetical protein